MKENIIATIAVIGLILGGWALSYNKSIFSNGATFGASFSGSGMLAENYIPYVLYNGGYNSAKDIQTTGNINGAIGTFSGALLAAAGTFSGIVQDDAGILNSYTNSTSTSATAYTLVAGDINAFDAVVITPNVGNLTLTFPASSTVSTFLPAVGDHQHTCFVNGTTTANTQLIFAGGTGFNLQVASSSISVVGSTKILPGKTGCFDFIRGASTATTFDINAAFTAYQ